MINLETAKLTNAINRAKQIRPRVRMTAERTYSVTGSRGANYTVFFAVGKDAQGRPVRMGECTCEAGRNAMPCFHLAAAAALNIAIHTMRQQVREAAKAAPVALAVVEPQVIQPVASEGTRADERTTLAESVKAAWNRAGDAVRRVSAELERRVEFTHTGMRVESLYYNGWAV